jgi:hypothetical protein
MSKLKNRERERVEKKGRGKIRNLKAILLYIQILEALELGNKKIIKIKKAS